MEQRKQSGWMIVTLACVVLIVAAAVIITMLAVSGKEQASNGNGQSGSVSPQASGTSQPSGGGAKSSGANVTSTTSTTSTTTTNDKPSGGNGGGSGQTTPATTPNLNDISSVAVQQITGYTVDKYELEQAALSFLKGVFGTNEGFKVTETRISQIDPTWGRVIVEKGNSQTLYFCKQGGNWTNTYKSSKTPSDI